MNKLRSICMVVSCLLAVTASAQKSMSEVIEEGLSLSRTQALIMAKELAPQEGRFPRSFEKGKMITSDYRWWCSGFYPGVLWLLYADKPTDELRHYAELFTDRCEPVKKMTDTHDLGFMLYCSYDSASRDGDLGNLFSVFCSPEHPLLHQPLRIPCR